MSSPATASPYPMDRTHLPIAEPNYPHSTVLDARDATPPPRFEIKAPEGAPNVVIVLIDDMGFGMPSSFGGPVNMPCSEALAANGLRYNQFHTTALCSPTRTALLSGRNHHMNNMGGITEIATSFPGNTGQRPANVGPLAETLRLNGYSTAFFGKNHGAIRLGSEPFGPHRPLAHTLGLRRVLRLHRRGDQPVGTHPLSRPQHHSYPPLSRLQLHDRHDRSCALDWMRSSRRPSRPTSPSSSTSPQVLHTLLTTRPRNGSPNTKASLTKGGTSCARKRSLARIKLSLSVMNFTPGTKTLAAKPRCHQGLGHPLL